MREILVPEDNNMPLHEALEIVLYIVRDLVDVDLNEDERTAIGIVQRLHDAVETGAI